MASNGDDVSLSIEETNRCAGGDLVPCSSAVPRAGRLGRVLGLHRRLTRSHTRLVRRLRASLGMKPLSLEAPQAPAAARKPPPEEAKPDADAIRAKLAE